MCTQGITDEKRHGERASDAGFLRFRGRKMSACVFFGKKFKKRSIEWDPDLDS